MDMYEYLVRAIAAPGQSDAGKAREIKIIAYADNQALIWAQQWFQSYAVVQSIIQKRLYSEN